MKCPNVPVRKGRGEPVWGSVGMSPVGIESCGSSSGVELPAISEHGAGLDPFAVRPGSEANIHPLPERTSLPRPSHAALIVLNWRLATAEENVRNGSETDIPFGACVAYS